MRSTAIRHRIAAACISAALALGLLTSGATSAPPAHAAPAGPGSGPVQPVAKPDLRSGVWKWGGFSFQVNETFTFGGFVSNKGTAASAASLTIALHKQFSSVTYSAPDFSCTQNYYPSGYLTGTWIKCQTLQALQPEQAKWVTVTVTAPAAAGTYKIQSYADVQNVIVESNELNNNHSVDAIVSP